MPEALIVSVILNTNRREDTLAALESLAKNDYANHRAIVLDNASSDGSLEAIQAQYPAVQVIPLTENLGYAGNNNVGIAAAAAQGADWVFVLNEDTLLASDCLRRLAEAGEALPQAGILGPMVYHFDEPQVIQSAGGRMSDDWRAWHAGQNELDQGQYPAPRPVEWISGCAILVRRAVIEQAGMLDARFFYYFEETEWCLRAREAGWQVYHIPQAHLWHKGVQRNYQPGPNVTYYATRNRLLLFAKHRASPRAWLTALAQTVRTLLSWSLRPKWRAMRPHRDAMWQGLADFFARRWGMRRATR